MMNNPDKRNLPKQIFLNTAIIVSSILLYSPGFLALSPLDPSVLRASLAIFGGIAEGFAFIYGNSKLMKPAPRISCKREDIKDISQIAPALAAYRSSKHFSSFAETVEGQARRFGRSVERAKEEIGRKFEPGSMSWSKYISAVEEAGKVLLDNIFSIVSRIQFFDEAEYEALKHYKEDNIPDDIQEKQIELYEKNIAIVKSGIRANEQLILGLDTLSLELSSAKEDDCSLLDEINTLTKEVKYYL